MIAHIVLFEPRAGFTDADRAALMEAIAAAARTIPHIRRFQVGRRVMHGVPGYERAMRENYEYAAVIEFDTVSELRSYLAHPSHAALGRHFAESSSRALAYDYEITDLSADART